MKEKVKAFFKENGRLAILIIFILEIILTMFVTPNKYDDEFFIDQMTTKSISEFVVERYSNWTSRVVIEAVLCFVLKTSKYLWILIQAAMVALAAYSMAKLFIKENKNENTAMLVFMILIFPMSIMNSAGWAATTLNYMWPLAMGLFSLIPIRKIWDGEKIKFYEYPLYVLSLLFAANQEQAAALLLGSYVVFTILMIIKNKKIHPFMIIQTLLVIGSLVFILTCPGNYVRNQSEIVDNFKDLEMYNFMDKLALGITSTYGTIIGKGDLIYLMFTFLMLMYVCINYKERLYKIVAAIPFLSPVILCYLSRVTEKVFPFISSVTKIIVKPEVILTAANCNNLLNIIPFIFASVNIICIILTLLIIFKKLNKNLALLVFLAGLASRVIMGFSATIWASGERTMVFFDFAMIAASILIWQELIKVKEKDKLDKKVHRTSIIIKTAGVLQYINVLLFVLLTQK